MAVLFSFFAANLASADCEYELKQLVGWTIVDVKTIQGFQEPGERRQGGFEGCNGDTRIFFTDGSVAECMSLGLQLALMPKAIIFGKEVTYKGQEMVLFKMLVDGHLYDVYFH